MTYTDAVYIGHKLKKIGNYCKKLSLQIQGKSDPKLKKYKFDRLTYSWGIIEKPIAVDMAYCTNFLESMIYVTSRTNGTERANSFSSDDMTKILKVLAKYKKYKKLWKKKDSDSKIFSISDKIQVKIYKHMDNGEGSISASIMNKNSSEDADKIDLTEKEIKLFLKKLSSPKSKVKKFKKVLNITS